ncbi:GOLPH3/VPS74 family protein [Salininema proteolyticum]|uniref:GPP34 family phosphoprotein n=1 Tax=Salininema proteolyticum TaxID=1607685 RepID=A0ABV8U1Q2_9ACTN
MILPEAALLLLLDDETGKPLVESTRVDFALEAAFVAELIAQGAVKLSGSPSVLARTSVEPADPMLKAAVDRVDNCPAGVAMRKIPAGSRWNDTKTYRETLYERLKEQNALTENRRKVLKIFTATTYTPGANDFETPVVEALRRCLLEGDVPDERTAALTATMNTIAVLPKLFPSAKKRVLKIRAEEIRTDARISPAMSKLLSELKAAFTSAALGATGA